MNRVLVLLLVGLMVVSCNYQRQKRQCSTKGLRVISLVPSLTKELVELGMTDNIVGATSYCEISKQNRDLIIGSAVQINMEKVLLLKPDVVFAGGLTKVSYIESLKKEGIKVYKFLNPKSYDEICGDFIKMGKILGREHVAKSIVSNSRAKLDSICKLIPIRKLKLKFFFQIGAVPIYTVIKNTFMDDYITFVGCENIAFDLKMGTMSRESVLRRNPDVICIATMGIVGDNEKLIWESYKELSATVNKKIFIIDSDIACSPTVLSFVKTLEQIIHKVYRG